MSNSKLPAYCTVHKHAGDLRISEKIHFVCTKGYFDEYVFIDTN